MTSEPSFIAIVTTVEIARSAEDAWKRIGSYADAGKYLSVHSELNAGEAGIGSVRKIGDGILEVMVGSGIYSYSYAQTVGPMAAYTYHGSVSLEPLTAGTCRLVYTISYDQASMSAEERQQAIGRITPRFKGMADAMKADAEAGIA